MMATLFLLMALGLALVWLGQRRLATALLLLTLLNALFMFAWHASEPLRIAL